MDSRDLQSIADAANLALEAPSLAADIVSAFVRNNPLPAKDLPGLITAVHAALIGLTDSADDGGTVLAPEATPATAADIRKSITPDAPISFIDGKPYKMLRRHLGVFDLSPAQYRARFGLPSDYPMVAPNYSAKRSELAKSIGLGRGGVSALKAAA